MKYLLIIVFLLLVIISNGQTSYYSQNDSTITRLYKHFSDCQTLKSSKAIDKKKIDIDHSLVRLCNDLFNSTFTKQQLQTLSKKFSKTSYDQTFYSKKLDSVEEITFTPYFNGNLRVSYSAVLTRDSIISFKISIGTNTQVDCNSPSNTAQYFDFVYLKRYFLKEINFPLSVKPLDADIIVSKEIK